MLRIKTIKSIPFNTGDEIISFDVPVIANQDMVRHINFDEYSIYVLNTKDDVSEINCASIAVGQGATVGYIIPGSAVLSGENPNFESAAYCAYNLIAACLISKESFGGNYSLFGENFRGATVPGALFKSDSYYLVTWTKKIGRPDGFRREFALSLSSYGFYFDLAGKKPKWACRVWDSSQKTLRLKSANSIPGWVTVLLTELAPYTESPFLRFFYAYQIIEYLMGRHLNDELSGFRDQMNKISDPTVVEVRDLLERLQGAMKEKVRIKAALQPICGATDGAAESMLDAASIDRADLNFAEKIYKIRNTLFHDYRQVHSHEASLATLADNLSAYLLEDKLMKLC